MTMTNFVVTFHNGTESPVSVLQSVQAQGMEQSGPTSFTVESKDTMLVYLITAGQGQESVVPWTANGKSFSFHSLPFDKKQGTPVRAAVEGKGVGFTSAVCEGQDCTQTDQKKWPNVLSNPATVDIYF